MSKSTAGPVDLRHEAANNRGMHKDLRAVMGRAADDDWTGVRTGKGGIRIVSPDGEVAIYLPLRTGDPGRTATDAMRKVERWDAADAKRTVKEHYGITDEDIEVSGAKVGEPTARCKEHDIEFASWEGLSAHIRQVHKPVSEKKEIDATMDDLLTELDEGIEETIALTKDLAASTSGTLAASENVKPWRAILQRHKDGTVDLYESEAVLEVEDEGEVIYRCSLQGCGYEAAMPRSVRSHYAAHVKAGDAPEVGPRVAVETGVRPRQYARKEWLQESLSREIYLAVKHRPRRSSESLTVWANALTAMILANREDVADESVDEEQAIESTEGQSQAEALIEQMRNLLSVKPDTSEIERLRGELSIALLEKSKLEVEIEERKSRFRTLLELAAEDTE